MPITRSPATDIGAQSELIDTDSSMKHLFPKQICLRTKALCDGIAWSLIVCISLCIVHLINVKFIVCLSLDVYRARVFKTIVHAPQMNTPFILAPPILAECILVPARTLATA